MNSRHFVMVFFFVLITGMQTQATENSRYKKLPENRKNDSGDLANENRVLSPSEMEKFSRAEVKKKLEELDAVRKRSSGH